MRIVGALLLVLVAGCSQHADIAIQAANKVEATHDSIVKDLETLSIQSAVDKYSAKVETLAMAAEKLGRLSNDADAHTAERSALQIEIAQATNPSSGIVPSLVTDLDKITWLTRTQHERARNVNGVVKRFIYEQQSWFDVIVKEWNAAERNVSLDKAKAVLKASEGE